jgi:hypothetical protein
MPGAWAWAEERARSRLVSPTLGREAGSYLMNGYGLLPQSQ